MYIINAGATSKIIKRIIKTIINNLSWDKMESQNIFNLSKRS